MCGKSVGSEYFHVNDKPVCGSCRDTLLAAAKTPRTAGPLLRAGLFGLAAAIAGGVYWSLFGWPLAAGLVVGIYIHEMGHVAMLRRLGIASGAPLFIPGVGALVMLKQHVDDPIKDARIGLAGPEWGLGAALAALGAHAITNDRIWLAIGQLTGFLSVFNLIPVWQLDGSRGFHALSRVQRWIVVGAIVAALYATEQRLLFIVGGVAVWRATQREAGPGDNRTLATFVILVGALSWIAMAVK